MKSLRPSSRDWLRSVAWASLAIFLLLAGCGKLFARQHTVTLSWTASKSPVVGYDVYRRSTSNGPSMKLNSQPIPGTKYVDPTAEGGQTYAYYITAVDYKGFQSTPSTPVLAAIPWP
jgi:fibronectin type 3 domain-containing protein